MSTFNDTSYHICFSCSNRYATYASVCIQSILDATKKQYSITQLRERERERERSAKINKSSQIPELPFTFHILCDTLTPETLKKLKSLESKSSYPCKIIFHTLSQDCFKELTPWGEGGATWHTYFRLKVGDVLDSRISHCVYLDVDTLILQDIRELFFYDIGENAIGVARNIVCVPIVYDGLIEKEKYGNVGVLLINLAKWREHSFEDIRHFPYTDGALEQDFVNYIFKDSKEILPFKWNFQWLDERRLDFSDVDKPYQKDGLEVHPCNYSYKEFQDALKSPAIVHFLGGYKPWEKNPFYIKGRLTFVQNPYHKLWWKIAHKSPFYKEIFLAYAKRSLKVMLYCYIKQYAPRIYRFYKYCKSIVK